MDEIVRRAITGDGKTFKYAGQSEGLSEAKYKLEKSLIALKHIPNSEKKRIIKAINVGFDSGLSQEMILMKIEQALKILQFMED